MKVPSVKNKLFRDSFWAVFGNGLGNALLLFAGIIIARMLGKDLYGQYGVVKTTMFYIQGFATFGLGISSTRYIAKYASENSQFIASIISETIKISFVFSTFIGVSVFLFSKQIAMFMGEPTLIFPFQMLSIIIITKALSTSFTGILAGFKQFDKIARGAVVSGIVMFVLCVPMTYYYGLIGSLSSLLISQTVNAIYNFVVIQEHRRQLIGQIKKKFTRELVAFSLPITLQEGSYTICNWFCILTLTKMSSIGEVGLYTAAAQWCSIILFVPGLLTNVILSYLSSNSWDKKKNLRTIKYMLSVNFISTFIPFVIVYAFSTLISRMYGPSFSELPIVLKTLCLYTIFECCSNVFRSELISKGKTWYLFFLRFCRDILLICSIYVALTYSGGQHGALYYSMACVFITFIYFLVLAFSNYYVAKVDIKLWKK